MHQKLVLFSGFIFSLLLHAALFNWFSSDIQPISAQSAKPSSTVVSLCAPVPKEVKKEKKPKTEKPKKKPKPKPVPTPEPEAKKAPLPEEIEESVEDESEEEPTEESVEQAPPASQQTAESQISTDEIEARKNIFLQELRETIKRNKSYPKVARRRRIQGEVSLEFCVLADGSLAKINIKSGKKVFYTAVKEAVVKSSPIVNPPEILTYPLDVTLILDFRLK